jgi:hypothetical protein
MSVVFVYAEPANDLSQLHDELLAAGLAPERVEGLGDEITLTFPDGQARGPVDAVVAAHTPRVRYDPATRIAAVAALRRDGARAAGGGGAGRPTTLDELRAVLVAHLTAEAEEEGTG